jgi:hypothetical protein
MQQLRQATSPIRLRSALRAIRLEAGPAYEDVLSRIETTETAVVTTGPLPAVRVSREQVIQAATVNPAIIFSPERRELHLAGVRTSMIGTPVRLPDGLYEMYDLFYHELNPSRIMARVRPVEVRS